MLVILQVPADKTCSHYVVGLSLTLIATFSFADQYRTVARDAGKKEQVPNILMIVADDLGYSDLSTFGGEIETPNLDGLAATGMVMTNFHAAPACSISRKILFTGKDMRYRGADAADTRTTKLPFFTLDKDSVTFPQLLKSQGYGTYIVGKWDLGPRGSPALAVGNNPMDQGFDRAFWLQNGGGSHYSDMRHMLRAPSNTINYFDNREKLDTLPASFYSSTSYTDKAIEFISEHTDSGRSPFFLFASYTAPHWPLHASAKSIEKYEYLYEEGYAAVHQRRIEKMRELGIIDENQVAANVSFLKGQWDSLGKEEKQREVKRMQLHAAMVDSLDENIGRLLSYLKDQDLFENTLILFFSDNGADGNNPADLSPDGWIIENFDNSIGNIGNPGSYEALGPNWATVSSAPFRLYKAFTSEGGTRSPFIASHGQLVKPGANSDSFATIADIYPTLIEVAGISPTDSVYQSQNLSSLKGRSMLSHLSGEASVVHASDFVHTLEYWSRRSVRQGKWKATWINEPIGDGQWELFDIEIDVGEQADLSDMFPEKLQELVQLYEAYAFEAGVIDDPGFEPRYSNTNNFYD